MEPDKPLAVTDEGASALLAAHMADRTGLRLQIATMIGISLTVQVGMLVACAEHIKAPAITLPIAVVGLVVVLVTWGSVGPLNVLFSKIERAISVLQRLLSKSYPVEAFPSLETPRSAVTSTGLILLVGLCIWIALIVYGLFGNPDLSGFLPKLR